MISNGRLDFGVGAGWNEYEHQSMGIRSTLLASVSGASAKPAKSRNDSIQQFTDFDGRYYQLNQARLEPKPIQKPYPPIVIGGSGEQLTLRVVARYASIWNFTGSDVETFRHKVRVLHEHCAGVGRDPEQIELSVQVRVNYDDLPATVATLQPLSPVAPPTSS